MKTSTNDERTPREAPRLADAAAWKSLARWQPEGHFLLETADTGGLAVLACIVTATPGTSWAQYDAAGSVLTLHVLDLLDEDEWVRLFKDRYERRLMEIFE